jgi:aminoglycoside 3-N-acetyltransferase
MMLEARRADWRAIVKEALAAAGVRPGDVLCLHVDALVTAQFPPMPVNDRYDLLIDAILDHLGGDGTLVMPTFTYSFGRGEVFSVARSPSMVGAITEHFRCRQRVFRSANPMFSFAACGRDAEVYASSDPEDSFGVETAFSLLHRSNAALACLGCSFDRTTFVHYIEQSVGVDYRFFKMFAGVIEDGRGNHRPARVRGYVRDLNRRSEARLSRLRSRLLHRGLLRTAAVGRVGITMVRAGDMFSTGVKLLREAPHALILEGAEVECA